jgi:hypothetical protein
MDFFCCGPALNGSSSGTRSGCDHTELRTSQVMQTNPNPAEVGTALTNIPLGLVALIAVLWLWRQRALNPLKAWLWAVMFGSLVIASDLAVFVHGFELEPETSKLLWRVIYAALTLTVSGFAAGAVLDRWGPDATRRTVPGLLVLGAAFFYFANFRSYNFLPFIVYETGAMLLALAIYVGLAVRRQLPGAVWMAAGILITLLAAAFQATRVVSFTLVVPFNHNAVFHLVQLPGLLCLLMGLRSSLAGSQRGTVCSNSDAPV